jgi:hypothetical protein
VAAVYFNAQKEAAGRRRWRVYVFVYMAGYLTISNRSHEWIRHSYLSAELPYCTLYVLFFSQFRRNKRVNPSESDTHIFTTELPHCALYIMLFHKLIW